MKKLIYFLSLCAAASISYGTNDTPKTNEPKKIKIHESHNSYVSDFVPDGITSVAIEIKEWHKSTIAIKIPLSVQDINVTGNEVHNSSVILYMSHNPQINKNIRECHNSTIQEMHPLRQYTYHAAFAAAMFGLYYYFKSK
jgi:hypothetical protein